MEVVFSPDQQAQLDQLAAHNGTDSVRLIKDPALRLIDESARFKIAVSDAIAQADHGQLIDDAEVARWLATQDHRGRP